MHSSAAIHPAIGDVTAKFAALELHAARAGREVIVALAQVALDSMATETAALAAEIEASIDALLTVMPPYAPPLNVMHRLMALVESALATGMSAGELRARLAASAGAYLFWSDGARDRIAQYGSELIADGSTVFTWTLSETALRVMRTARRQGKSFRVLVTESRPNQDGWVTARELAAEGVDVSVSIDACMTELIRQADVMIVGAEAIESDGSAICKVGTYPAALVARASGVPVYVMVDTVKFNITSLTGLTLKLDPIRRGDVALESDAACVVGHLFDCTPASLISGIVTERGIVAPAACAALMTSMPLSNRLADRLVRWTQQH